MPLRVISPFPRRGDFKPEIIQNVKDFLIKSFKGQAAAWPPYHCLVVVDGTPRKILGGSYYQIMSGDIYVNHDNDTPIPDWAFGVLLGIAEYFKLTNDAEIREAALELLANVIAGAVNHYQRMLAETFGGAEIHEMAINSQTKELAAKVYDSMGQSRYVTKNGEEIDYQSEHNWHAFAVPNTPGW